MNTRVARGTASRFLSKYPFKNLTNYENHSWDRNSMDGFCCSSPIIHAHVVPKRIDSGRKLQNDKIGYVFV